jgi:hypothetical protein
MLMLMPDGGCICKPIAGSDRMLAPLLTSPDLRSLSSIFASIRTTLMQGWEMVANETTRQQRSLYQRFLPNLAEHIVESGCHSLAFKLPPTTDVRLIVHAISILKAREFDTPHV